MSLPSRTVAEWLRNFSAALDVGNIDAATALFGETSYWRDLVAFTWDIQTIEGRSAISEFLRSTLPHIQPHSWSLLDQSPEAQNASEGMISFETAVGCGTGYLRLQNGQCLTLLTTLKSLNGFEETCGARRPKGVTHGAVRERNTWLDQREAEVETLGVTEQPFVLIVGAGQGGLGLGARLRQLGVPTLIVDRQAKPGDQWRSRYRSLTLHDPVWYDHMPYLPFPDTWPVFTPKDKMADWLESYAKTMELDIWGSTECVSANYDERAAEWQVELRRQGERVVVRPQHLVLATGNSGKPYIPKFIGAENFKGLQIHSSSYKDGRDFTRRRVVVVGSNNSSHDICGDLWESGADVTMVQRSSTHIVRSETLMDLVFEPLYSQSAIELGVTTEMADMLQASFPMRVLPDLYRPMVAEIKRRDADFYKRLEDAGFLLDFGEDESGFALKYLRRAAGYYYDVGASELIANGSVKLHSSVSVSEIGETSVTLTDGTRLAADVIIYATGFGSMDEWAAELISPEVARKIGKVWGYGSGTAGDPGPWEGELRNMWKPTKQEGLWFHGGNLQQSRFFSLYLALQLKARKEGLPVKIYDTFPATESA